MNMAIQNTCPATWVNSSIVPKQSPFQAYPIPALVERIAGIQQRALRETVEICPFLLRGISSIQVAAAVICVFMGTTIAVAKTAPVLMLSGAFILVFRKILNSPLGLIYSTL